MFAPWFRTATAGNPRCRAPPWEPLRCRTVPAVPKNSRTGIPRIVTLSGRQARSCAFPLISMSHTYPRFDPRQVSGTFDRWAEPGREDGVPTAGQGAALGGKSESLCLPGAIRQIHAQEIGGPRMKGPVEEVDQTELRAIRQTATVAATVRPEYWGHFMSVAVGWRRGRDCGELRQILEKAGKTLKRNGGDDGARTRDLRRDRPALCTRHTLYWILWQF